MLTEKVTLEDIAAFFHYDVTDKRTETIAAELNKIIEKRGYIVFSDVKYFYTPED